MIPDYEHHTQYYETDQMGCVHHSNYIRWMEEARVFLMEQMGCSYKSMEDAGILCPVLEVSCKYEKMVHFGEIVRIRAFIREYSGVRLKLEYEIRLASTGEVCTTGHSAHCFLTRVGKPLSLKRSFPEWDETFRKVMAEQADSISFS